MGFDDEKRVSRCEPLRSSFPLTGKTDYASCLRRRSPFTPPRPPPSPPRHRVEVTGIFRAVPKRVNPKQRVVRSVYKTYVDVIHFRCLPLALRFPFLLAARSLACFTRRCFVEVWFSVHWLATLGYVVQQSLLSISRRVVAMLC